MSEFWLPDLSLIGVERRRVKSLRNFQVGHRVPTVKSTHTDAFIGRTAEPEIADELETRFAALKTAFAFKRRDVTKDGPTAGQGVLVTPTFDYVTSVTIDETDPTIVAFERRVTNVTDLEPLLTGAFDDVFATLLDMIDIPAPRPIDVEAVIDEIEDADPDELVLDYNADGTECRVSPRGTQTLITVTGDGLTVRDTSVLPSELLQTAASFRRQFVDINPANEPHERLA